MGPQSSILLISLKKKALHILQKDEAVSLQLKIPLLRASAHQLLSQRCYRALCELCGVGSQRGSGQLGTIPEAANSDCWEEGAGEQLASQDGWHASGSSQTLLFFMDLLPKPGNPRRLLQQAKTPSLRMPHSHWGLSSTPQDVQEYDNNWRGDGACHPFWLRACLCCWTTSKCESVVIRHR